MNSVSNRASPTTLVTGASGHIGNVLVRQLLAAGQRVRAIVPAGEDRTPLSGLDVEIVEGDILNPESIRSSFDGIKDIYHLAGLISILPGKDSRVRRVNVQGTRNIIRLAQQAHARRMVYASSIHALFRAPKGITIDENAPFDIENAISSYDSSKAEASLLVEDAAHLGLDTVIVCPTGVVGPFDYRLSEMGQVILDAMKDKPQLCVDGAYDFVDVRDVAQGLILASLEGRSGERYILSGERLQIRQIVKMTQETAGVHNKIVDIPLTLARFAAIFAPLYYRLVKAKPRLTPYAIATVTGNSTISSFKARRELGYTPRALSITIADTVNWFLANRNLHSWAYNQV
jgi:dihydroflavonol-4-reductase